MRAGEKRKAEDRLEALLLEGLSSPEIELRASDWADIRNEALSTIEARSNFKTGR